MAQLVPKSKSVYPALRRIGCNLRDRLMIVVSVFWPLAVIAHSAVGSTPNPEVDAYLHEIMIQRHIPGLALGVVRAGHIERIKSYGLASVEFSVAAGPTTVFNVASVTKSFTAVGVMKLVEEGKVGLDDTIGSYLAGLPDSWRPVRIRNLLDHTSGLPDITKSPSPELIADTPQAAIRLLQNRSLDFEPDTQYRYDQTDYMLLGLLIEKESGRSFAQFCKDEIFAPAKLNGPVFGDTQTLIKNRGPIYTPYRYDEHGAAIRTGALTVLTWKSPPMVYPNNGLNISAQDFARWLAALMNNRIIGKKGLETLLTQARYKNGKTLDIPPASDRPWRGIAVGGLLLIPDSHHPAAGGTGGPYAAYIYYPKDQLAVVVLTNSQESDPDSIVVAVAARYLAQSTVAADKRG